MISIAHLTVIRAERGISATRDDLDAIPAAQWGEWFRDLAPLCHDRRALEVERRPGNALNVEIGAPVPRCLRQSPDGRGLAWLHSGGSVLAYGACSARSCPRAAREREHETGDAPCWRGPVVEVQPNGARLFVHREPAS